MNERREAMTSRAAASRPLLGIALMSVAMLVVPSCDAIAKLLTADLTPIFISWARYAAGSLMAFPVALALAPRGAHIHVGQWPVQLLRTLFMVGSMTLYYLAIARVPLVDALGAFFVGPIVATFLAALVLRERLTARKLTAVGLGFGGALLIVRPGSSADAGLVYALLAGLCFSCYVVATRLAAQASDPLRTLALQYALGTSLLTPFAIALWQWPSGHALILIAMLGLISAACHLISIFAFRFAEASTLSPLLYLELVGSAVCGYALFGDLPSATTWVGIGVIVIAGLIVIRRGGQRGRTALRPVSAGDG
jgi:drug/metabolite transporter (DMT)-like permease